MSDNNQQDGQKKKKKKQHRFLRHRDKYKSDIDAFDVTAKSPITNGMVYERAATDVFCAIAFGVAVVVWFGILGVSISQGDVQRIFAGVNGDNLICGAGS